MFEGEAVEFVRTAVASVQDRFSLIDVTEAGNGLTILRLNGLRNHRRDSALELFRRIASALLRSYGLLYVHDPEDSGHDEIFRVFRMARGKVEEFADMLLSPRFSTIGDNYEQDDV